MTEPKNGMRTWRDIGVLIPLLILLSSAGVGWGVHQASLESQSARIAANTITLEVTQDKLISILDRLARIETKLDAIKQNQKP